MRTIKCREDEKIEAPTLIDDSGLAQEPSEYDDQPPAEDSTIVFECVADEQEEPYDDEGESNDQETLDEEEWAELG